MSDEIVIKNSTFPGDEKRKRLEKITLRNPQTGAEIGVALHSHPIWKFNPQYAGDVTFKMENIQEVLSRADVLRVMGYPLLTAGLHLFDLGIKTVDSSPHAYPTDESPEEFFAYMDIDANSLNTQNKKIADQLVTEGIAEYKDVMTYLWADDIPLWAYRLKFPINKDTKAEEVQESSIAVANRFVQNKNV